MRHPPARLALIGDEFSAMELNASVLDRLAVDDLEACERKCLQNEACVAMEFYVVYNTYCSAEDPVTSVHSNWTAITATYQTARTGGCFNCGNLVPPDVVLWGGFVGATTIGSWVDFVRVVASASEPGRIFCNAFPVNGTIETLITAELVREPNFFAILASTGTSVAITIGDLTPMLEYEVACMAESDGGAESTQQQIDSSRRKLFTEEVDSTISSMRITREEPAGDLLGLLGGDENI
eukprot:Skav232136  [mRNA]  locus=scaffold1744:176244:179269:- [translate_table: standard]